MIVLAILGTLGAIVWTWIVFGGNAMSDAPSAGFQGGWSIAVAWIISAVLWTAWWFN